MNTHKWCLHEIFFSHGIFQHYIFWTKIWCQPGMDELLKFPNEKWTFGIRVPGSMPQLFNFDPILILALSRLITTDSFTDESFRYDIFGALTSRTIIFGGMSSMETIEMKGTFSSLLFSFKELSFVRIKKRNVKRSPDGPFEQNLRDFNRYFISTIRDFLKLGFFISLVCGPPRSAFSKFS